MSIDVFISYSPDDDAERRTLETHLTALQRSRLIRTWSAHKIGPGQERRAAVDKHIDEAHLILLLISPSFLASDHHYEVEVTRALDRRRAGSARVIPIILRPVDWKGTLIDGLTMLPENARPVSSSGWGSADKAWLNVALGLRGVVDEMMGRVSSHSAPPGRSFVGASEGFAPRGPHPSDSSSARIPTRSRPDPAVPVITPYPSPHSAARTTARSPTLSRRLRLPLFAALLFGSAGVAAGVWTIAQPATTDPATSTRKGTTMVAPLLPAPSPSPTLPRKSEPAPVPPPAPAAVAGPCCGGVDCAPGLQDTRGSACDRPDRCAACASLRRNVDGACRDPLDSFQRFRLRLARLNLPPGRAIAGARVCVRMESDPTATTQCTNAMEASDAHPGTLGAEQLTRLPVTVGEIVEPGRGLDIEVQVPGQPSLHGHALTLKSPPLLRSALCRGVSYTFGGAIVYFYLDDMGP